jgi:hypothetical protein
VDADEVAAWRAIEAGETKLSWDVWSAGVERSAILTDSGKRVVREAVDVIAGFLGPDWLGRFLPVDQTKPAARALPLLSPDWWPTTNNRNVYERVLTLASRLRMLASTPGLASVRRSMSRDLGHFEHSLLQVEVASLALRDGWHVTFEPKPDPAGTRVTDLRLSKHGDSMLVEVKGFVLDDWVKTDLKLADTISVALLHLEVEHEVHFSGQLDSPRDMADVKRWLAELTDVVIAVARDKQPRESLPSFGGRMRVAPGPPPVGTQHTMPIRHRDEWGRISAQIEQKSEQGRGDEPLWLRFEETPQFWALAGMGEDRLGQIDALAAAIEQQMTSHDHVAGMLLSGPARALSTQVLRETFTLHGGPAAVLSCTTMPPFWRESLVVPGPHARATEQVGIWSNWYLDEGTWLVWALEHLNHPSLNALFVAAPGPKQS